MRSRMSGHHPAGRRAGRLHRAGLGGAARRMAIAVAGGSLLVMAFSGTASARLTRAGGADATPNYVALGDSYTSGPLIPDQTGSPLGCLRSNHDYPALVAAGIGAGSFKDVSCQGASTANMTHPESVLLGSNPPQDDALSARTTLVTLQIGGNNINFSNIIINCTTLSLTDPFGAPCKAHYTKGRVDHLAQAIAGAAPKVAADLRGIHADAPSARVLVVGYPAILPNTGDGCWPAVPIAYGDVPYLRGIEKQLNAMLAAEAAANGATYVDTYTASIGHDACQPPGVKWVEGLIPTSLAAPFHPNALGERGMAQQVLKALR
jgi:lysophospholipase L1-like esterase